jgi:WD40 repeat protein
MAQRLLDEHPDSTQANRRPPQFSPHVKISTPQSITAFAAHGRYGCVAHHSVKVFDTQLSGDQPILTFDQRDTGMETRSKEPRITAMGFRPSSDPDLQGRYLWCGNKDGHLWELDIQSGEVTAKKPGIHGGAVTHIMHHGLSIVTIDDMGKLHIWDTAAGAAEGTFKVTRTLRISDKVTFAKMIQGRLWTAVAPVVRSATNTAASRGPTVRVYDLTVPGNVPPPLVALTTEWTGAATSATVMPLGDPNEVFIGHEGGFVSIWSTTEDQLICQHVLKVASTDILSLEGVGERLWAGNRRGQIHVWNITEKPWRTSNVWTAHE